MINPNAVFVADATPALAEKPLRSAYVFGANTSLGDVLLNQLLASPAYSAVYISTLAALPSTVVHLQHVLVTEPLVWQDNAQQIDCFLLVQPAPSSDRISRSGIPQHIARKRHAVYAPLYDTEVPSLLRQLSNLELSTNNSPSQSPITMRWLLIAPESTPATLDSYLASYAAHVATLTYSGDGDAKTLKSAYRFESDKHRNGFLDKVALLLLNTLSNVAHGMMAGKHKAPLTTAKLVQGLLSHFDATSAMPNQPLKHLQRENLLR